MTNINLNTLATRIDFEKNKKDDVMTAANIAKLERSHKLFSVEAVSALLTSASVNVAHFAEKNVYVISKIEDVLQYVQKAKSDLNDMNRCVFRTALNLTRADLDMTRDDAKDACSKSRKVAKERKQYVVQNDKNVADSTVNAQHASSLDALMHLNVLAYANKSYRVNLENDITKKLIERLAL